MPSATERGGQEGWAAGAAESTGPTCDHSKSLRLLQPALEAGGVGVRPSRAEAPAGGSLVSSQSSLFRHHATHSQAPRTGRPPLGVGWGAKSGAASPTGTGQGHRPLRASRRPPGRPHLACVGGHVLFESMGNDLPHPPREPGTHMKRAQVGERPPLSSDAIKAGTSHGKSNALLA